MDQILLISNTLGIVLRIRNLQILCLACLVIDLKHLIFSLQIKINGSKTQTASSSTTKCVVANVMMHITSKASSQSLEVRRIKIHPSSRT